LYEQKDPPEPLQNKLNLLLTTPFVSNAAAAFSDQAPLMVDLPLAEPRL
jgi:hypothetical protein